MADNIIEVRDVVRTYRLRGETVRALDGISIDVPRGRFVSIMGPSGSGKSTLFNVIGGLDQPDSGSVKVDGVDLASLSGEELAYNRCMKIGYIFQNYNLIPVFTALQNVSVSMAFAGLDERRAQEKAGFILELVGLGGKLNNRPAQLSGGQQQRVAIARALANEPSIILADEPTANLDKRTGEEIIELLSRLCREYGVTVVSATHDHKMLAMSDFIVWIRDGKLERVEDRKNLKIVTDNL